VSTAKAKSARTARKPASKKAIAQNLAGALAEAGWLEADRALIAAMLEARQLEQACAALKPPKVPARVRNRIADSLSLLSQSLAQAGRRRGIVSFGVVDAVEPFDPARHEITGVAKAGLVTIVQPGLLRGAGVAEEILLKARAKPAPKRPARRA